MELPPLAQHQLKRLLADGSWRKYRSRIAWGTLIPAMLSVWLSKYLGSGSFFQTFSVYIIGIPVGAVCGKIIQSLLDEIPHARRERIDELLSLSGLSLLRIWAHKAMITLALSVITLSALAPSLLACACTAHMSISKVTTIAALTLLLLLYVISLALVASVRTRETGVTFLVLAIFTGLSSFAFPSLLIQLEKLLGSHFLESRWLLFSPIYGYFKELKLAPISQADLVMITGGMIFWIILFLVISLRLHGVRNGAAIAKPSGRLQVATARIFQLLAGYDSSTFSNNPLFHLLSREKNTLLAAWSLVLMVLSGILYLLFSRGLYWFNPFDMLVLAIMLALIFQLYLRSSAERILAEARQQGLLELVLTTELSPKEFIMNLESGVQTLYMRLYLLMNLATALLCLAGSTLRPLDSMATTAYVIVWAWVFCFLYCSFYGKKDRSFWIALNLGRPSYSVSQLWMPALIMLTYQSINLFYLRTSGSYAFFSKFPWGNAEEMVLLIFGSVVGLALTNASFDDFTKDTLLSNFRAIAAEPIPDSNDERIAKWDRTKPFPTPKDS